MTLELHPPALIDLIRKTELVAFVGAGLSIPSGGLSWLSLCRQFLNELNVTLGHEDDVSKMTDALKAGGHSALADKVEALALSNVDPLMLAQMYQDKVGRNRVIQVLREMCERMSGPSSSHSLIASLGITGFVTTNYDDLLERALEKAGHSSRVVVREEDAAYWNGRSVRVIKMHGSLVNPFDADSVVIAREDYEAYAERRPNIDLLVRFLMTTGSVLLLGYSARDPNFLALHDRVRFTLKKNKSTVFFVAFDMPISIQDYWKGYGFYPIVLSGTDKKAALDTWLTQLKSLL